MMKYSSTIPVLVLLVIIIGTLFSGVPAFAATGDTLKVGDSYGLPGQTGTFEIILRNVTTIKGLYFTLTDFPDSLTVTDVQTTARSANFRVDTTQAGGALKVLMLPLDPGDPYLVPSVTPGGDPILEITVNVATGATGGTTADLTLDNIKMANTTNGPVTKSKVDGRFWFGKKLDVVYNGVIDLFDVLRIVDISLDRGNPPTAYELWAADWDDDGLITVVDIGEAMDQAVGTSVSAATPGLSKSSGSVKLTMPALPANFTGKVDVPVTVSTSAPLYGVQMQLELDSDNYVVGVPQVTETASGMTVISRKVGNKMNILMCGTHGQSISMGESTIMTIPVTVQNAMQETASLNIKSVLAGTQGAAQLEAIYGESGQTTVVPETFALHQNHPNPFNMNTMISFDVPNLQNGSAHVKLEIFNTRGQLVKTLVDQNKQPGRYTVHWNGSDNHGRIVSSGVYFYRFSSQDVVMTKKMAIMK